MVAVADAAGARVDFGSALREPSRGVAEGRVTPRRCDGRGTPGTGRRRRRGGFGWRWRRRTSPRWRWTRGRSSRGDQWRFATSSGETGEEISIIAATTFQTPTATVMSAKDEGGRVPRNPRGRRGGRRDAGRRRGAERGAVKGELWGIVNLIYAWQRAPPRRHQSYVLEQSHHSRLGMDSLLQIMSQHSARASLLIPALVPYDMIVSASPPLRVGVGVRRRQQFLSRFRVRVFFPRRSFSFRE